jgi:aryl-alcohol dehydrogenase-like predicted oxidoreductase
VRQGKVRYVGASNFAAWQLMKALGAADRLGLTRFASLQSYYSLVGRDVEQEILPAVRDQKVGMLVYSPLAGGFLPGKFSRTGATDPGARRAQAEVPPVDHERGHEVLDVLRALAARHGAGVSQVALAWVLAQPGVTSVILGARRPDQLAENLAAVDLALTPDDLRELELASAPAPSYPGWLHGDTSRRFPAAAAVTA